MPQVSTTFRCSVRNSKLHDFVGVIKCSLKPLVTDADESTTDGKPTISFKYLLGDPTEIMKAEVNLGKKEWEEAHGAPSLLTESAGGLAKAVTIQSAATAVADNVVPFLDRVSTFVKLVDNISEVRNFPPMILASGRQNPIRYILMQKLLGALYLLAIK